MKKILLLSFLVAMVGCRQQVVIYSRTDKADWLTRESRGDNLSDYNDLYSKAESMCAGEGFKDGIHVIDARPGGSIQNGTMSSYTLAYQCKGRDPSVVDKIVTAYGQVRKQLGN